MTAKEVKKIRTKLGLSQAKLGALLGCAGNTVWRWEAGMHPPSLGMSMLLEQAAGIVSNRAVGRVAAKETA